ncbi:hypothetical protein HERIO_1326 [Hepatospora eriocheir]|uniref:Uncharacterized protein n=1 Tax=Hepatospora eriocheir TaxID=1081669 RepID=A0A1X0QAH9_9MICR|nr:hypothetical protein HERIO_1326 [Hepatospora eriocheir]
MLMCNLYSFYFFFNILLIIIPNIYSFLSSKVVENVQLTRELKKYISSDSDLNKNYKNYLKKKMLCLNLKYHLYSNIYDIIGLNKPYKSLWNENPILVICSLLFYRFFFLSLFEFKLFYKSIEKHKAEYRKGYFGVVGYLLASYLISIREFTLMIICDIITFIYFTRNLKMLSVLIIFYLLTLNFIYLICLGLSISFNTVKFYLLSGIIKFILSSILIYFNSILNRIIWRACTFDLRDNILHSPRLVKIRRLFVPFNLLSDYTFSMKHFMFCLLMLACLNLLIIYSTLYKLKKVLKGGYGKFNLKLN